MVGSVARYLTLSDKIPAHWENALKKNGQLSVDIIRSIQHWHLEGRSVPDVRDVSQERGRGADGTGEQQQFGFSAVESGADGTSSTDGVKKEEEVDEQNEDARGVNGIASA